MVIFIILFHDKFHIYLDWHKSICYFYQNKNKMLPAQYQFCQTNENFQKLKPMIFAIFQPFLRICFDKFLNIFHKTEVQVVILRCWTGLNPNWFKSYDTKRKYFSFCIFRFCKKTPHLCNVFSVHFIFFAFLPYLLNQSS